MKNGFKQLLTHGFTRLSSVESQLTTRHRLSDYLMDVSCHASEIKEQAQDPRTKYPFDWARWRCESGIRENRGWKQYGVSGKMARKPRRSDWSPSSTTIPDLMLKHLKLYKQEADEVKQSQDYISSKFDEVIVSIEELKQENKQLRQETEETMTTSWQSGQV